MISVKLPNLLNKNTLKVKKLVCAVSPNNHRPFRNAKPVDQEINYDFLDIFWTAAVNSVVKISSGPLAQE